MSSSPKVSVVLPTFNRASHLKRSIGSVLDQTFQDLEIIVVDDASTDNTEEVIRGLKDPRIRYLQHEENRGGSAARNTGIEAARGNFIAFQDSDDEWLPEKLEKQMRVLEGSPLNIGVVYTGFWRIVGSSKEYIPGPDHKIKEGNIHLELLKKNFITTQAVVVKKECFQRVGVFDENLPRLQDWDLFIRIARFYEFRYVPESLVNSFYTEGSISSKHEAFLKAFEIIFNKNREDFLKNESILANHYFALGDYLCKNNLVKLGRKYFLHAFKFKSRPGYLISWLMSLLGKNFYTYYGNIIKKLY